jgi:serine/threonine protein kinase
LSNDPSIPVESPAAAPTGGDALAKLSEMLDGKFKVLSVMESDVDSYTLEALRVSDERAVIVRLLKLAASNQKVISERFKNEASKRQLLVHHNVPRCIDQSNTESGQLYAVLVNFRGDSLRLIFQEQSCIRVERAIGITTQIWAALTAAHRLGVVEHSLSPRNIYLTSIQDGLETVKMLGVGFVETLPAVDDTFMHGTQSLVQNDS